MRWLGLSAIFCAGALLLVVDPACLVAPPTELPPPTVLAPQIERSSAYPDPDFALADWPDMFAVTVDVLDPNATIVEWTIAIDGVQQPTDTTTATVNNGTAQISQSTAGFSVDLSTCHQILLTVVDPGVTSNATIGWTYSGSAWPYGCPISDASGIFTEAAASDSLSVGPNSDP